MCPFFILKKSDLQSTKVLKVQIKIQLYQIWINSGKKLYIIYFLKEAVI